MYLRMMRRARERRAAYEAACPCKQTCRCHHPSPGLGEPWGTLLLLSPFLVIGGIALMLGPPPATPRTIHVWGHVCPVVWVKTGQECSGRHNNDCHDIGYDDAQCDWQKPAPPRPSASQTP